ncbi:MAG: hypothetical protein KJ906_03565 [Nanoarchaeota archaeon]|nr:hypothetical protein [Nanoarchaeota archaeon]
MNYESLKEAIVDTLNTGDYTVQNLCQKIGVDNPSIITGVLARPEMEKRIKESDYEQLYESDGTSVVVVKFCAASEEDFL